MDDRAAGPWHRLSRRVYENSWIAIDEDVVELPSGATTLYGIVRCGSCVGMLPFVDADHVLLVQQFRYITGQTTWEMPTGVSTTVSRSKRPPSASSPKRPACVPVASRR